MKLRLLGVSAGDMATPVDGGASLRRERWAIKDGRSASPHHGEGTLQRGAVSFQEPVLSEDEHQVDDTAEEEFTDMAELAPSRWRVYLMTLIEKKHFRRFFRVCAVINILSLICSAPFNVSPDYDLGDKFAQFVAIAAVDLVLCVVYTLQTIARALYTLYLNRYRDSASSQVSVACGPPRSRAHVHAQLCVCSFYVQLHLLCV